MDKFYGIHDQWTDLDIINDVAIKSTDGVIDSVKVNGEEYGGGGSSDFSTAEVTFINNSQNSNFTVNAPYILDESLLCNIYAEDMGDDFPYNLILYKGQLAFSLPDTGLIISAVTGDITAQGAGAVVTGAGTITITDAEA